MANAKINNAITECLQRCYRSDDTIATIARYVGELQDSIGWSVAEIHAVELAALKMLGIISVGVSWEGDVSNWKSNDQIRDRQTARVPFQASGH